MNAAFRKYGLGCHPANLGRPFAAKTNAFAAALEELGFAHAPEIQARVPGRYQIEVFPHASIVWLFGLPYRLKYKKGTVPERVVQLRRLREFLFELEKADPPCLVGDMLPLVPDGGAARKGVEDRLDAVICAYTSAHYWWWSRERNRVFGDGETGFLVVPGSALVKSVLQQPCLCLVDVVKLQFENPGTLRFEALIAAFQQWPGFLGFPLPGQNAAHQAFGKA